MFNILSSCLFWGISVFIFFFGMHIMQELDNYMGQRKKKKNEYEEARRQGHETII